MAALGRKRHPRRASYGSQSWWSGARAATDPMKRHTRLSHSWALVAIGTVLVVMFVSLTWLIGAQVRSQASYLLTRLPQALQEFEQRIGFAVVGSAAQGAGGARANGSDLQDLVRHFLSLGNAIASALSSLVLVNRGRLLLRGRPGALSRRPRQAVPQGPTAPGRRHAPHLRPGAASMVDRQTDQHGDRGRAGRASGRGRSACRPRLRSASSPV
jgi:hypothetical protein